MNQKTLGKQIKAVRIMRNLKQAELSEMAGLSISYISLLERGQRSPSINVIDRIAEALDIEMLSLIFLASSEEELGNIPRSVLEPLSWHVVEGLHSGQN